MAYINSKGQTQLVPGDRVILKERLKNFLYTFEKGEECEILHAKDNGDNFYAIISLDGKKRLDGVTISGLINNSIQITYNNTKEPLQNVNPNLSGEILLHMFRFAGV